MEIETNPQKNPEKKEIPTDQVRSFCHSLFEKIFSDGPDSISDFGIRRWGIDSKLAEIGGASEFLEDRIITPRFREITRVFFLELLDFVEKQRTQYEQRLPSFVADVYENFFSYSPSLIAFLDLSSQLEITARTTRVPELQAYIGPSMISEMTYDFSFGRAGIENTCIQLFEEKPLPEQLDLLHVIQNIGINAAANGEWSLPALNRMISITKEIEQKSPYPFVQFMAHLVYNRLSEEMSDPSQGVIQFQGRRGYGRSRVATETARREHHELSSLVVPDCHMDRQDVFVNVARDAVGIGDGGGLLQKVAIVERSSLRTEGNTGTQIHMEPVGAVIEKEMEQLDIKTRHLKNDTLLFQQMHHPKLREYIQDRFGFSYMDISLYGQMQLLKFLSEKDEGTLERVETILKESGNYKIDVLESFLAISVDKDAGNAILGLFDIVHDPERKALFVTFRTVVEAGKQFSDQYREKYEKELHIDSAKVFQNIIIRAKDIVVQAYKKTLSGENPEEVVRELIDSLEQETQKQRTLSGMFRRLAEVFKEEGSETLDLRILETHQTEVYENDHSLYLRALHERRELKPIPEIHWRVDRGKEEYQRRFGFDVIHFLKEFDTNSARPLLLEFGPGSGKSKAQRKVELGDRYIDMAMADTVYYSLAECIYNLIDWEKITEIDAGKPGLAITQKILSDALYKLIMIRDGDEEKENFSYATERIEQIQKNPEDLKKILQKISSRFRSVRTVPSSISSRTPDGRVFYPYKVSLDDAEISSMKDILANQLESGDCIKDTSIFDAIPARPEGMIIGDFSEIQKLQNTQIDVGIAVRATVYKRDNDWKDYIVEMSKKLSAGGVLIDDSIRDNDGWYYRCGELQSSRDMIKQLRKKGEIQFDIEIYVILGPGFPGEDYSKEKVPLAFILSKESKAPKQIQQLLDTGFKMKKLDEVLIDKKYLAQLDTTGQTLAGVVKLESEFGEALAA
jgi:hypothetical protein